jgi:hypothetical protein
MVINQGNVISMVSRPLTVFILTLSVITAYAAYRRSKKI